MTRDSYLYLMKSLSLAQGDNAIPLGIGYYTTPGAARLLEMPARTINRWLVAIFIWTAASGPDDRTTLCGLTNYLDLTLTLNLASAT